VLRGTPAGLEFVFGGAEFGAAWAEMAQRLAERPEFYRGSSATAIFEGDAPDDATVTDFVAAIGGYGIVLRGFYGPDGVASLAERLAQAYLGPPPRPSVASFERKRAARAERAPELTEKARSLDADFAGARADIANRRARGEPSVPRPLMTSAAAAARAESAAAATPAGPAPPSTLYHRGSLRGGQALQQLGTIVIVGDVNPGAELVATGDIVVFGALRGTAHAGAQGDGTARVMALELAPTQLRIATLIAADFGRERPREPEVAFIEGDRIAVAPHAKAGIW
jgi:septum site-determining protein MinC